MSIVRGGVDTVKAAGYTSAVPARVSTSNPTAPSDPSRVGTTMSWGHGAVGYGAGGSR